MNKSKWSRFLASLLVCLLVIGVPLPQGVFALDSQSNGTVLNNAGQSEIPADKRGGTFRWGSFSAPIDLNPMLAKDMASSDLIQFLNRGLVYYDENYNLKPDLLTTMPTISADGLTYDFQLKPNLKWEDNNPITANDVKFTIDFTMNPAANSPRFTNFELIKQVDVINDTQFRITLTTFDTSFLYSLSVLKLIPKHIWENIPLDAAKSSDYNTKKTLSCGPYVLKEYSTTGGDITLERNPNYSSGMPYNFDRIILKVYPSQALAMQGLELGEVDFTTVPESDYYRIFASERATAYKYDRHVLDTVIYNHKTPYFEDKRVRKAFSYLLDKDTIIRSAYKGLAAPAHSSWHPLMPGYNRELPTINYNVEKAKELLDNAGWLVGPDGLRSKNGQVFKFKLITNKGNTLREATCKIVAAQLKAVGITAEVEFIDWSVFLPNYVDIGNFDAYVGGFSFGTYGDQTAFYHSDRSKAPFNKGGYANPELDRLLNLFRSTPSENERQLALKQIQAIVNEDQPMSTFAYRNSYIGLSKSIGNVRTSGFFSNLDIANYYFEGSSAVENPLKITFNSGVINTVRTGTPTFAGSTNASKNSVVKATINTTDKVEITSLVSDNGNWTVTVPSDKNLLDGQYIVAVEITDALLGKNTKYLSLKVDRSILFEGEVALPNGAKASDLGYIQIYQSETGTYMKSLPIDQNGKFYISGLASGNYRIEAVPHSGQPYSSSISQQVTTDGVTPNLNILKLAFNGPQIFGAIQTPEGAAIGGCYVRIESITNNFGNGVGASDSGRFTLGNLKDGIYDLRAVPNSNFTRTDLGASKPFRVTITNGFSSFSNVTLKLSAVQLAGKVLNDAGHVVSQSRVEIYNASERYVASAETKSDGSFGIAGLEDGTYDLEARVYNSVEYTKSVRQRIQVASGAVTVVGGSGNQNPLVLTILRPQVTGLVKNQDGTPHLGGWINYGLKNGGSWSGYGYDNQGRFAIGGLSDGIYQLRANPNSNAIGMTQSLTATFEISNGVLVGNPGALNLVIQPSLLKVTVKSPPGLAQMRSNVFIRDGNGMHITSISTNEQGICYLPSLASGVYQISAEPDSNNSLGVAKTPVSPVTIQTGTPLDLELRLQLPQVKGLVKNPDSSPAMYSWIEVRSGNDQWVMSASVNSKGEFYLSGLTDGQYKLVANPPYRSDFPVSRSNEVTINILNGVVESKVELYLSAPQVIGKVLNVNGSPVSGGWVQLIHTNTGKWLNGASVNAQGQFTFSNLEPGNYAIEVVPNRQDTRVFNSSKFNFTIASDKTGPSNIVLQYTAPQATGVVKDPLGQTVANVLLELRDSAGNWLPGLHANQNGEFAIGNLEVGKSYFVVATPRTGSAYSKSAPLSFTVGGSVQDFTISLTNAMVEGQVTKPDGVTPAAYTYVSIFKKQIDHDQFVQSISVGQDGKFGIGGLEPGDYEIFAGGGQYGQFRTSTGSAISVSDQMVPSKTKILLSLRKAQVTGRTINEQMPISVEGYVELYNEGNQAMWNVNAYNGEFSFNGLQPGKYALKAFVKPGEGVIFGDSNPVTFEIGSDLEVKPESTTGGAIDLVLSKNFISGSIASQTGITLGKAWVEIGIKVDPVSEITWLKTALVGNNGRFTISGLQDGTYYVQGFYNQDNKRYKSTLTTIVVSNQQTNETPLTNMPLIFQE